MVCKSFEVRHLETLAIFIYIYTCFHRAMYDFILKLILLIYFSVKEDLCSTDNIWNLKNRVAECVSTLFTYKSYYKFIDLLFLNCESFLNTRIFYEYWT